MDRLLRLGALDAVLVRERVERVLAAQREHEILARDAEFARDTVDGGERDPLDRLAQPVRRRAARASAHGSATGVGSNEPPPSARYGTTTAATSPSATRSGSARLTRAASAGTRSGTRAHSVSAAARRNGPENALVTARSS